jgi:hypothetical protein
MEWFGKPWGAPVCKMTPHCRTPVDMPCARCKVPIKAGDQGMTMPCVGLTDDDETTVTTIAYHLQCYLDTVICPGCARCQPLRFN